MQVMLIYLKALWESHPVRPHPLSPNLRRARLPGHKWNVLHLICVFWGGVCVSEHSDVILVPPSAPPPFPFAFSYWCNPNSVNMDPFGSSPLGVAVLLRESKEQMRREGKIRWSTDWLPAALQSMKMEKKKAADQLWHWFPCSHRRNAKVFQDRCLIYYSLLVFNHPSVLLQWHMVH